MAVSDGSIAIQDVRAELGDVVTGAHTGRRDAADITLFNSVGIGMQDLAIGRLLFDAAMSRGIGLRVDLGR